MGSMKYLKLFYDNWYEFEPFTLEERGRLITALFAIVRGEKVDEEALGNTRYVLPTFRKQLERDKESYDRKVQTAQINGAKGGRPKSENNLYGFTETEIGFEKPKWAQEEEKEYEKEKDQEEDQEIEKGVVPVIREVTVEKEIPTPPPYLTDDSIKELAATANGLGFQSGKADEIGFFGELMKQAKGDRNRIIEACCLPWIQKAAEPGEALKGYLRV